MLFHDMMLNSGSGLVGVVGVTNIGAWSASINDVALPTGFRAGDIAFFFALSSGNSGSVATPSGFTLINNEISTAGADTVSHASYKVLTGSETTYNLTEATNGTVESSVFVVVRGYSGFANGLPGDNTDFSDVKVTASGTSTETMNNANAGFTLLKNDGFLFVGLNYGGTWTNPTNYDTVDLNNGSQLVAFYKNTADNGDETVLSADATATAYLYECYLR